MSATYCGCDPEAKWTCEQHKGEHAEKIMAILDKVENHPFIIKDSGTRQTFAGGMQRDITEGKTNYLLVRDGPMYKRWAEHLTNGAKKYDKRNWMKGVGQEELDRAKESADRHFAQWLAGDVDEDHAAAVIFNINQVEYLKAKL